MDKTKQTAEVTYWNAEFEKCKSAREPFERQWYTNFAMYNGRQYATWAPMNSPNLSNQRLVDPPAPRYRVRLVSNKIRPIIRTEVTKLTKEEPRFFAVPATTEPSDIAAAKISENVLEYVLDSANFNKARRKATFWMTICGSSFIKTYVVDDSLEQLPCNIVLDDITPYHIFVPNLQEQEIERQEYVMQCRAISAERVFEQYGVEVKSKDSGGVNIDQRFLNALGIKSTQETNLLYMKEIWIKPCKRYPRGGMLVIVGDEVIYHSPKTPDPAIEYPQPTEEDIMIPIVQWSETEYPYAHKMFPYVKIDHIPSGSFYGTSVIDDLIPLQRLYNKDRSQIVESQNRAGKPQMVYTKGSLDANKVTSEPGLMIPLNPGFERPNYMTLQPLPNYVLEGLDRTLKDMDDITKQYDVANGRSLPGVTAASAISYIQEENDSVLYHTVASIEDAVVVIGQQILALVQEFWDQEKMIKVVSKNGLQETIQFKAADIKGNTDIRIESGSMAPTSRTARQAFITELMKMGILDPSKGLKYLEMSTTNTLYEEMQVDNKAAQRENYKMSQDPTPMPVNPWDNNEVHKYEHGTYLKSQEFELLPPEIKQNMVNHYFLTEQAIMGDSHAAARIPSTGDAAPNGQPPSGTTDPNGLPTGA